ncbi:peptidoglycan DD-metalloendopeptidase family protein [Glycomyces sp. L485]|uniref:M23 family metallopeptidase n=1 Tax=Glycomyces sp. L485 TaxID=2909235 RepID=UPI001F4B5AEF|nr:M23 family metallopeptidase [Glycomyces sp. L485]MCH7230628.1 peptidoglycan DD-metalloendopeptidase family protein [Glycomyces sp. L485]
MPQTGSADEITMRRHAARPHRVRGQHRASWAAELAPLVDGTQRRYTAVVGSAVAGASIVAMATAGGLPDGDPDPAASEAVADIAAHAEESARTGTGTAPRAGPAEAPDEAEPPGRAESKRLERHSPVAAQPAEIKWMPMLDDVTITSLFGPRWGRNHNGIDFSAPTGTPVYAAYSGTVEHAGWESGFGNLVIIDHGDGVETYYAHNSEIRVYEGQRVEAGAHISDAGNTGFSFGSHLHFEVHVDGEPVEPLGYLESAGLSLS